MLRALLWLSLLLSSCAWADMSSADLSKLSAYIAVPPYSGMTPLQVAEALNTHRTRLSAHYVVTLRILYDKLDAQRAEAFNTFLASLKTSPGDGAVASHVAKWMNTDCGYGINVGAGSIRDWLVTVAKQTPEAMTAITPVLDLASESYSLAADNGWSIITSGDVLAARAVGFSAR